MLNKDLKLFVSPGTLYSNLYALERQGFVECRETGRKRICKLTYKGKTIIDAMQESSSLKRTLFLMTQEVFPAKGKQNLAIRNAEDYYVKHPVYVH